MKLYIILLSIIAIVGSGCGGMGQTTSGQTTSGQTTSEDSKYSYITTDSKLTNKIEKRGL